jgi:hypothetical protein
MKTKKKTKRKERKAKREKLKKWLRMVEYELELQKGEK